MEITQGLVGAAFVERWRCSPGKSEFKVSEDGGVRASENSLLHKSNEKTGKIVRINFLRTLESN